jgi:hypothetical protein
MVSIPHFEDLSAQRIYDSLDLQWWVSEKLDGSYLKFGLDDEGFFYTQRKGGSKTYTLEEFPEECWADTYKIGHTVAGMVVEGLRKEGLIGPGQGMGAEILQGCLPNTVPYQMPIHLNGMLVITTIDYDVNDSFFKVMEKFQCSFQHETLLSNNGWDIERKVQNQNWLVKINPPHSMPWVQSRLGPHAQKLKKVLDRWFPTESNVKGFTILEVLDISLSKKHPNCGDRNWNELKKELMKEREELREVFSSIVLLFKDIAQRVLIHETPSVIGAGSFKEGVVVATDNGVFKIVDRQQFSVANQFTHRIKYMIVGGRRPARPSFLSRTKDWPIDKRLARLRQLLDRFESGRHPLHYLMSYGDKSHLYSYSGQLAQRTLNMFRDTRKRIEDGR